MERKFMAFLLAVALLMAFVAGGCTEGTVKVGDSGGNSEDTGTKSFLLGPVTDRQAGSATSSAYLVGNACSNYSLSGQSSIALKDPSDVTYEMGSLSGYALGNNYYYGSSDASLGRLYDPLSESAQRQFGTGPITAEPPLDGDYTGIIGSYSATLGLESSDYMAVMDENDLIINGGGNFISSLGGSAITLTNQTNSSYRYLCVIYNGYSGSNTYENLWASADIREIDWIDTDSTADFFKGLAKPVNNQVSFNVPGGVLEPDSGSVLMIMAVDGNTVDAGQSGDIRTLTYARSILHMTVNVQ